ncbi:hypothetical protein BU16DRAFT_568397 [Lophium mytilinum]|uniref:F-box domain-containing protein n=1 Tax=Lophium mytilinum TaxID=390894 RepID=A0A6A6Q8A6_9PEZI|nr:hypothetical protein BU16DRAFT_568397 [Lophium mytilinum]
MPELLDLPNELVDQVVSNLSGHKTDLCNLSLVSRRVRNITKATLYGLYSYELFQQAYSFRPFLRTILRDPMLASYTRTAKIRVWRTAADIYSFLNEPDPPRREDLQLFVDAGRYVSLNSEPDWYESIIRGVEDAEVMLLVSQLPNLRELHLAMPPSTRLRWHFVSNEAQKARHGLPAMYHSLTRLCVENGAGEGGFQVGTLAPFLGLPSLRIFEAYQCQSQNGLWTAANFNAFAEQNIAAFGITSINLEWSILSIEAITALITSCKALKSFKYTHHYRAAPRLSIDQFDARQLIKVLSRHCETLEHLELGLQSGWDPHRVQLLVHMLVAGNFRLGDLRPFRKLATLDCEQTAFMTTTPGLQSSSRPWTELLPTSLKKLVIRACDDDIVPCLSTLASSHKTDFPLLGKVQVTAPPRKVMSREAEANDVWYRKEHLEDKFGPDVDFKVEEWSGYSVGLSGFIPPPPSWRS